MSTVRGGWAFGSGGQHGVHQGLDLGGDAVLGEGGAGLKAKRQEARLGSAQTRQGGSPPWTGFA